MSRSACLVLLALLPLAGCSRPADPAPSTPAAGGVADTPVPFRRLAQLSSGGPAEARQGVVPTAAEWEALWAGAGGGAPLPEVDFTREEVIVAAAGTRPSGGHEIEVESVRDAGSRRVVVVRETAPGSGCMNTQALTQPADFVAVPRRAGAEYAFETRRETTPCE